MKIHRLSCLSRPSLILLCLEAPAAYVRAGGATYVLVISPTTVTYHRILLYCFAAVFILDNTRIMDSQEQ